MKAGTVVAGRFEIVGDAGRGGMAKVYRATDKQTGGLVALKVLRGSMEELNERFRREADVLASLSHPAIVGYVASGALEGARSYLAMSWIEGETVAARIRRVGPFDPAHVVELGARVAEALAAAHALGVVHRDVKPSNILLASEGYDRPVLVDFGVARVGGVASAMTHEGLLIGTPGFISPEQARGVLVVDARADQFSLGCVLYACLTGQAPFRGEELIGVLAKILFQETPRVRSERRNAPAELDGIVAKAMAKDPDDRFPDALALATALRRAVVRQDASSPSLSSRSQVGISESEARLAAMVLVGSHDGGAATIGARFGGDVERLANGGLAIRFIELAGATERALAAARCALALRREMPMATISLATVRGSGGNVDLVKAIDRAAELARDAPRSTGGGPMPIRIDETTAGLLDARFDVRRAADGLELVCEHPADEPRRVHGVAAPCVGRDRELLTLDATLDEVGSEGIARAIVVTAEAGVGKSRLRREWLRRVRARGDDGDDVTVWTARADPLDSRAPHGLLAQAIRRAVGIADDEPLMLRQERLREHLMQLVSASEIERVLPFMAEMIGAPFDDETARQLAGARADRKLMADGIRRAFTTWVLAATSKPLVIALDDAHWSDVATLRLLDAALEAAADHPLLVAVFARPALRATHPSLFAERRVQDLRLEELPKRSAERLARTIAPSLPDAVIERVVGVSNGNAFFLEELLHAVVEGKGDVLPDTVLSVVEARLEGLEPDARRVLRAASVFGQFFWPGGVAAVLHDTDEDAARTWIGVLVRREVVVPRSQSRFGGEPELTFRHAIVRDTAYSMLTPEDRVIAHRAVAAWLEARGEQAAVLAAHLEAGDDRARAAVHYMHAASQMLGSGAVADARDVAERGLACQPDSATRAEFLMLDAEASRWMGDLERVAHKVEEVLLDVPEASEVYRRALAVAILSYLKLGRLDRHRELVDVALRHLEHAPATTATYRLAATTGVATLFAAELTLAGHIDTVLSSLIDRGHVDLASEAQIHSFRAFLCAANGDLEGQVRQFDASADCYGQIGDERNALMNRANAAFARTEIGDYEAAAHQLTQVLRAASESRLETVTRTAHCDLASTLSRLGRFEDACTHARFAVAGFAAEGDHRMECASRAYLSRAFVGLHDLRAARAELEIALDLAYTARQILPYVLATLSEVELAEGRSPEAVAHAEQAIAAWEETKDGANDIFIGVAYARALIASGRTAEARRVVEQTGQMLDGRVALVRDPRLAACYARVAENVELTAMRRALQK